MLLTVWLLPQVNSATTMLRSQSKVEQQDAEEEEEPKSHLNRMVLLQEPGAETERVLQDANPLPTDPLAIIAEMHLQLRDGKKKNAAKTEKCVRNKSKKILRLLNEGFEEVVGRYPMITGTMAINNHACGPERRHRHLLMATTTDSWLLREDGEDGDDDYSEGKKSQSDDDDDDEQYNRPTAESARRHLPFKLIVSSFLFRGGAICRLCYNDFSDADNETIPVDVRVRNLEIELSAHLSSVMQLSGIRCIERRSPHVNVTLQRTSGEGAKKADCEGTMGFA